MRAFAGRPHVALPSEREAGLGVDDLTAMRRALELAREALALGEVPVGAVVVCRGRIVAQSFNLRETLHDPTAHAERLALTLAGRSLGTWRLDGCTLYVTLEPCPMCAGAIVQARLPRVIYAARDPKAGACDSLYRITADPRLNHRARVEGGLLADESRILLTEFFQSKRLLGKDESTSEGCLSG